MVAEDKSNKAFELQSRLNGIREHLGLRTPIDSPEFDQAVVRACRRKIDGMVNGFEPRSGEDILRHIADQLQVRFEEVHEDSDIASLERKYLQEKGEIGFGQLEKEINAPGVDALLFQRLRAEDSDDDKWVAVLNLRDGQSRGYWNRAHELIHRIAEPPQYRLPFYRHRNDNTNRLESLIDKSASELAFYQGHFRPIVESVCDDLLSWKLIDLVRRRYAPSASRLASAYAVLRNWRRPAYLLTASIAGRKKHPDIDQALRVNVAGFSAVRWDDIFIFPNMRVPPSSPIWHCFHSGEDISDYENLDRWVTSGGDRLPDMLTFTSAFRGRNKAFALVSPAYFT